MQLVNMISSYFAAHSLALGFIFISAQRNKWQEVRSGKWQVPGGQLAGSVNTIALVQLLHYTQI